jgi:transposase InsO family protein
MNGVVPDLSRPGRWFDNAFAESFNDMFGAECLKAYLLLGPKDTQSSSDSARVSAGRLDDAARPELTKT